MHFDVLPLTESAPQGLKENPLLFWKVHGLFADAREARLGNSQALSSGVVEKAIASLDGVARERLGEARQPTRPEREDRDRVPYLSCCDRVDQDLTILGRGAQPRGQIHDSAERRIIHTAYTPDVAYRSRAISE